MKICLAGTYAMTNENKNKIKESKYILESFYYINEWQISYINKMELFLLDSGAFTYMNNIKEQPNWDEYIERYADFIKKNNIKYFFELDIDALVGYDEVKRLRNKLEKLTGRKCIPVWHKSRGIDEYKKMIKDYDYVAIGGIVTKEIKRNEYKYLTLLLEMAKKENCRVHGLGFTNLKEAYKYHFYSVDSTSWKSGNRFGSLYKFENNELKIIKKPENKRMKSGEFYSKIEYWNFREWCKYQDYADKNY